MSSQSISNTSRSKITYGINNPLEIRLQSVTQSQPVVFTAANSNITVNNDQNIIVNSVLDVSLTVTVESGIPSKSAPILLGTLPAAAAPNNLFYVVGVITSPVSTTISVLLDTDGSISVVPQGGDYGSPAPATVVIHAVYIALI